VHGLSPVACSEFFLNELILQTFDKTLLEPNARLLLTKDHTTQECNKRHYNTNQVTVLGQIESRVHKELRSLVENKEVKQLFGRPRMILKYALTNRAERCGLDSTGSG
jgi:hypothetical protein